MNSELTIQTCPERSERNSKLQMLRRAADREPDAVADSRLDPTTAWLVLELIDELRCDPVRQARYLACDLDLMALIAWTILAICAPVARPAIEAWLGRLVESWNAENGR